MLTLNVKLYKHGVRFLLLKTVLRIQLRAGKWFGSQIWSLRSQVEKANKKQVFLICAMDHCFSIDGIRKIWTGNKKCLIITFNKIKTQQVSILVV